MHHVAVCFSDSSGVYYKHALVTVASVFASSASEVCVHVVHDDTLSDEARGRFLALDDGQRARVMLHNAARVPAEIEAKMPRDFNRGAVFRLMLHELIQEDLVLYLDCDIVCECDVADVFRHDVRGHFMGAVRFGKERVPYFVKRLGLIEERYMNSGVLLMNLKKLREELPNFVTDIFEVISKHHAKSTDQEALNIFFNKRDDGFLFMPGDYNFRIWQQDHAVLPLKDYKGKILHFSGRKPWEQFSHASVHYWKHYARLFPDEDVFGRMATLPSYEYAHLCAFMLRTRLARRIVRRMYEIRERGLLKTLLDRLTQGSGEKRPGAERR